MPTKIVPDRTSHTKIDSVDLYRIDELSVFNKNLPLHRLQKKPTSLRLSIDAMCVQCIYDPYGGTGSWRKQVSDCTSTKCALFRVRPQTSCDDDVEG